MLAQEGLNHKFWGEAITTACLVQNRSPHTALDGRTPYEMVNGYKPDNSILRPFGIRCWAHKEIANGKVEARAVECILLGYEPNSKAYRLMNCSTGRTLKSINVEFYKSTQQMDSDFVQVNDESAVTTAGEAASENVEDESFCTPNQSIVEESAPDQLSPFALEDTLGSVMCYINSHDMSHVIKTCPK